MDSRKGMATTRSSRLLPRTSAYEQFLSLSRKPGMKGAPLLDATSYFVREAYEPDRNTEAKTINTWVMIFEAYSTLFSPQKQLHQGNLTYDQIQAANETVSRGEMLCFLKDFYVLPE